MSEVIPLAEIQQAFLADLVERKAPVAVYLKNGIKLKGVIRGFDEHSLYFDHPSMQSIYISAVSTVAPLIVFSSFD